jgi:hypothetical protein
MNKCMAAMAIILAAAGAVKAQEQVDLDAVESPPVPDGRKAGAGIQSGDLHLNLWFDGMFLWTRHSADTVRNTARFLQEHADLLVRASTSDGIEAYANITHPSDVFQATVPFAFFLPSIHDAPLVGEGDVTFGSIRVPFGQYEDHPIYGGTVVNSMQFLGNPNWSDYGVSFRLVVAHLAQLDLYAINGIQTIWNYTDSTRSSIGIDPTFDIKSDRYPRGLGAKLRLDPVPALYLVASYFHDALRFTSTGTDAGHYGTFDLAGLDAGLRTGPVSWKLGGAYGKVASPLVQDYDLWAWYAESKYSISERWALRLRGGQIDPDSRQKDDNDQTNVNFAAIWTKGPIDLRVGVGKNMETHWLTSSQRPNNYVLYSVETFVTL